MPSALMRIFRSKKSNKENEPALSRTFSCRPSKSATTSPPPAASLPQANAGSGTIGGGVYMGNEDWHKRSAPYHVWSAPKTKKPIRSCPGGGFATNSSQTMMSMNEPVSRETSAEAVGSRNDDVRHHHHHHGNTTSEYGSADPSPTTSHMPINAAAAGGITHANNGEPRFAAEIRQYEDEHRTNRLLQKLSHRVDKLEKERYWLSLQLRSAQKEATKYRNAYEGQIRRIARFETLVDMERERNGQLRQVLYKADQRIREMERALEARADCELRLNALLSGGCGGAGEALCVLSAADAANLAATAAAIDPTIMTAQHDQLDEVKNFRQRDSTSTSSCMNVEHARGATDGVSSVLSPGDSAMNRRLLTPDNDEQPLAPRPPLRRTFSDTELHTSMMRIDQGHESDEATCSTSSSDSDSIVDVSFFGRQLRKRDRGVVRFQPRRPTIAERVFKRFGQGERTALAEFDYLQEMPSDVSGFASSPDQRLPPSNATPQSGSRCSSLSLSRFHSEHSDDDD